MNVKLCNTSFISSQSLLMFAIAILCTIVCAALCSIEARGQNLIEIEAAPPPLRYIPDGDRAKLMEARDAKKRTEYSIMLAEQHLEFAARYTNLEKFDEASAELGIYQALIEDAIQHLQQTGQPAGKLRDTFKKLELALRSHAPRIETIRRSTPSENAVNVKAVGEFVKQARAESLNSFYGDTVLRVPKRDKEKSPE